MVEKSTAPKKHAEAAFVPPEEGVSYNSIEKMMNGGAGAINGVDGRPIDSPEVHARVKKIAMESDLRVNRLSEISGYLRWAALGAATPAVGMLVALVTTAGGAAAFSLPIFIGFMAVAAGLGAVQMVV